MDWGSVKEYRAKHCPKCVNLLPIDKTVLRCKCVQGSPCEHAIITMCPEDLGFQECKSCTQMYVEEDMLHLEITETGLVAKKSCLFSFLAGSHKSFVPHTCTCKPAVSEPEELEVVRQ